MRNERMPVTIEGIRLERWMNFPYEDGRFRIVGVLLPKGMMKDPLSLSILDEIQRRVEVYESNQNTIAALVEAANKVISHYSIVHKGSQIRTVGQVLLDNLEEKVHFAERGNPNERA